MAPTWAQARFRAPLHPRDQHRRTRCLLPDCALERALCAPCVLRALCERFGALPNPQVKKAAASACALSAKSPNCTAAKPALKTTTCKPWSPPFASLSAYPVTQARASGGPHSGSHPPRPVCRHGGWLFIDAPHSEDRAQWLGLRAREAVHTLGTDAARAWGQLATVWRTECSQTAMRSWAWARESVGSKRRSACHRCESSSTLANTPACMPAK